MGTAPTEEVENAMGYPPELDAETMTVREALELRDAAYATGELAGRESVISVVRNALGIAADHV